MPPMLLTRIKNKNPRQLKLQIEENTSQTNQLQEDSIMSFHGEDTNEPPTPRSKSREKYAIVYTTNGLMRAKMQADSA